MEAEKLNLMIKKGYYLFLPVGLMTGIKLLATKSNRKINSVAEEALNKYLMGVNDGDKTENQTGNKKTGKKETKKIK